MEDFKRDLFGIGLGTSEWKKKTGAGGFAVGKGMHPRKFNSVYRLAFKVSSVISSGE